MSDFHYVPAESAEEASERAYKLMKAGYDDLPERNRKRLSLYDLDVLTKHLRWHYMQAEYQRRVAVSVLRALQQKHEGMVGDG